MQTVIIAFDDRAVAEGARERLVERGFDRDDIHLQSGRDSATVTGDTRTATADDDDGFFHRIARFFSELFGSDETGDSRRYTEAVRRGSTIVIVDVRDDDEAERARIVLEELGGHVDLDERSAQWEREGWSAAGTGQPRVAPGETVEVESTRMPLVANAAMGDVAQGRSESTGRTEAMDTKGMPRDTSVLPVLEEQVQVGKRQVQRGGVRVFQRMTETPVREMVRLREERAVIERHPVDRPATAADLEAFREGSIELRETVEEPVVAKTAHVVEEVVVGKRVEERTQTVEDVVRRSAVEVEPIGQGASERMLERTGGQPTTPVGETSSGTRTEGRRSDNPADPEIVERSR